MSSIHQHHPISPGAQFDACAHCDLISKLQDFSIQWTAFQKMDSVPEALGAISALKDTGSQLLDQVGMSCHVCYGMLEGHLTQISDKIEEIRGILVSSRPR